MGIFSRLFPKLIVQIQTKLLPIDLLNELIKIEKQMGRSKLKLMKINMNLG